MKYIPGNEVKICITCKELRPIGEFYKHPGMPGGTINICKTCRRKQISLTNKIKRTREKPGMTKIDKKLQGQTGIARKVWFCVPIQEAWTVQEIMIELRRNGVNLQRKNLEGCLWNLQQDGLVKESSGRWIKESYEKKEEEQVEKPEEIQIVCKPEPKMETKGKVAKKSPMDIMVGLSARCQALVKSGEELVRAAEDAALEISEYIEDASADSQKLRQLQKILQSVSG